MPWHQTTQGWSQDHRGQLWERWENSFGRSDHRKVTSKFVSLDPMLEPIMVESLAYPRAVAALEQTDIPKTPKQLALLQAIVNRGPTYFSIMLFHDRGRSI